MKYYIDMVHYEKFGLDYLTTVENYILTVVFNQMEERDFLDIYVVNWTIPLNVGIYRDKLHQYIPLMIKRLTKVDDMKHFFSKAVSIQEEEILS
jgi:hypothetical protein